jgi:penicillin-binding protein 1A
MEPLLVKIFATALTFSQVLIAPEAVRTSFDPAREQGEVVRLLQDGCAYMRKAFEIEDLNLDDLVATAMDDPQAVSAKFHEISFADLHRAYRLYCKGERGEKSPVDIGHVIDFYNKALADLPDHETLVDLKLPGTTAILDGTNQTFAEIHEPANRRISVPLHTIPEHVQRAFISAEDKRFYEHGGVDERGLIRAFLSNLAGSGGLQGGSTITQQVAKNLLVGNQTTYVRKMREMVVATRMEAVLDKKKILETYLNSVFLGRGAWGVEMAARSYFGKSVEALSLTEAAMLAGLVKGPTSYNPDRYPERARERAAYVLNRMQKDGAFDPAELENLLAQSPALIAYQRPRRNSGYYFVDYLEREARQAAGIKLLTAGSYVIRSTIDRSVQHAAEAALQEGLAGYEIRGGRARFESAEANLAEAIKRIEANKTDIAPPSWQQALAAARLPLYDVHWPAAVVVEMADPRRRGSSIKVGLNDGRVMPLQVPASMQARLQLHDVVYVRVTESGRGSARAELRVRPHVQGTVVVLENKTGRILALVGGFSYALSQFNRATQAQRQPGSALKPLTYLAALNAGLQPNTLVRDSSLTLPPIGRPKRARADDYWSPQNYDGSSGGTLSIRQALEQSRNLATAHLVAQGVAESAEAGLDKVCNLALDAQVYQRCMRYYPFVLGAQPVRPIDLARFYAAIANEGVLPKPYVIESISENDNRIYAHDGPQLTAIKSADAPAFYQVKSMLQGVVSRGTAARMADLAPYVAGKTGTTDDETDAWFVGFSNEVTIAVWVGYDNASGKRRTLGGGRTGANVAIPIFEPIMRAVWDHHSPKTVLAPPSENAARLLVAVQSDSESRNRRGKWNPPEYLRRDVNGKIKETRFALMGHNPGSGNRRHPAASAENAFAYDPQARGQPWFWSNNDGSRQQGSGHPQADSVTPQHQFGGFRHQSLH